MPISTVHQPAQPGRTRSGTSRDRPRSGCSAPTRRPSAAWRPSAPRSSSTCTARRASLGVVQVVDEVEPRPGPDVVAQLVNGSSDSAGAAVRRLNGFDVVVVQHEYGIYGGPDGVDVLDIVDALTVPAIVVLHTVLQDPTRRQRHILLRLLATADVVVTMTETARQAAHRELRRRPGAARGDPARRGRPRARVRGRPRRRPTARSSSPGA